MRGHHAATLVRRATRCTTCYTPPAMATVAQPTSDTKHMHQIPGRGVSVTWKSIGIKWPCALHVRATRVPCQPHPLWPRTRPRQWPPRRATSRSRAHARADVRFIFRQGLAEPERPAALRAERSAAPVRRGRAHTGSVRLAAAGGLSQQLSFCLPWLLRPLLSETGDEQPSQAKYSCVHEELGRAGWTRVPIINEVKAWQCQGES